MIHLIHKNPISKSSVTRKKKGALVYNFIHRKSKPARIKTLWIQRINSSLGNLSYSNFIGGLNQRRFNLNGKILSTLTLNEYISCFMAMDYTLGHGQGNG